MGSGRMGDYSSETFQLAEKVIRERPEWDARKALEYADQLIRNNPTVSIYGGMIPTIAPPQLMNVDWATSFSYIPVPEKPTGSQALKAAKEKITELTEILERVQKEPLILHSVDRVSKDKKHTYFKKGELELRIEAPEKLEAGDEVLLHPKTFQIVEVLGKPPLETSRFAPDSIPDIKWDDIGGLAEAKADLIEAVELPHKNKELFKFYNKAPVKGILLSGPPGCGKTMLGKASANSLASIHSKESIRTGFLYVKGPEILNCYVGATEQTIRDIFNDARRHKAEHGYPSIIFIDEADAILAARGTRSLGMTSTIVPMFLTEMDGLEESGAIVIIATNRPDILDPAIVRDGRIDRKVTVTRPDKEMGTHILTLNLRKVPLAKGYAIEEIAEEIGELIYSDESQIRKGLYLRDVVNGAMLANCVNLAVSSAIKRDINENKNTGVTTFDLKLAVKRILASSTEIQHDLEEED